MGNITFILIGVIVTALAILYYSLLILKLYKKEILQFLYNVLNDKGHKHNTDTEPEDEEERTEIIIKSSYKGEIRGNKATYLTTGGNKASTEENRRNFISPDTNGGANIPVSVKNEKTDEVPVLEVGRGEVPENSGGFTMEDLQELENAALQLKNGEKLTENQKETIGETLADIQDTELYKQMLEQVSGFSELAAEILSRNRQ